MVNGIVMKLKKERTFCVAPHSFPSFLSFHARGNDAYHHPGWRRLPRRHPPTRFIISRRRVRMVIGRIRKPGEKVSARPQKPRLGRFTQGVSATISMLATD